MKLHRRTFLRNVGLSAAGLGFVSTLPGCISDSHPSSTSLPRSTPEEQGVSSAGILNFLEAAGKSGNEFHSFMMVRHGHVIAEGWWTPYRPDARHMLYSLSKSFTSTAIGFAVTEGRLTVNDPVVSFFPDKLPPAVSDHLAALRVKHLLTMSVGRAKDTTHDIWTQDDWVKAFLAEPIEYEPGSVFLYNSSATFMLSAIVQKLTGQKVIDYLRPRLFDPLEIHEMTWETSPQGINTGGWGLALRSESLAKFGQFYLQKGSWNGKQLLPAAWIEEATSFKIQQPPSQGNSLDELKKTSEWHQGYCYQFWRCRHNAFRGDGAYGQFTIVMPDQDAVVVITSESASMQKDTDLVWDHLLPAIKDAPLPADPDTQGILKSKLASLALPLPPDRFGLGPSDEISGKVYQLEPNSLGLKSVSIEYLGTFKFVAMDENHAYPVQAGYGRWVDGTCNVPGTPPTITVGNLRPCKVSAAASWIGYDTMEMIWRYYETPHHDTVTCRFKNGGITVEFRNSIPGHEETRPVLRGRV